MNSKAPSGAPYQGVVHVCASCVSPPDKPHTTREFLSPVEVQERYGIGRSLCYKIFRECPHVLHVGHTLRVRADMLDSWLAERRAK